MIFIHFIFGLCVSSSKDAGAYDLGELDQALFLYLDGQDPSTAQDQQRRECFLSSKKFHFSFYPLKFSLSGSCFSWEDSSGKGAVWVTGKACSTDYNLPLTVPSLTGS